MRAFEASTRLTFAQAAANCQTFGGEIAQPLNPLDSAAMHFVLTNTSGLTSTSFWIGLSLFSHSDLVASDTAIHVLSLNCGKVGQGTYLNRRLLFDAVCDGCKNFFAQSVHTSLE